MAVPILHENFETVLSKEMRPVVVEFFAEWCPKCAMMNPIFERISRQYIRDIAFYKVDIDLSEKEATKLGIEIVPTFVVYHKGEILGYTVGILSERTLTQRILEIIKK